MDTPTLEPQRDRAPWRAPLQRTAVLAIDLQEAFFEDPSLAARRETLVARCRQVLRWAEREQLPVVTVRTVHQRDRSTWTITMLEDDQGYLFEGDDHTACLGELDLSAATQVVKTRDDAFVGTDLEETLRGLGVEALVVIGVSTHSCVLLTAAHAFAVDLEVVLVRDAIASHRPELHELTLDALRDEYRFPVLSADALCRVTSLVAEEAR
ncbi:cysteine hydrolase family protein [Janibacter terrae]|uniref:cysteine hydrolase family protein n=1 Tax=Janibacter terrae TaxID=103817 RepID=UPI00082F900B|nr:isochorismatase family cysteine hydrolase [Janibacter terrae]